MPWFVAEYQPVSLFSLKTSQATSTAGRSLLIPTPYAVKMACLDAGLRTRLLVSEREANSLVEQLIHCETRIGVPQRAVVTHTIIKVRQAARSDKKLEGAQPLYKSTIAYREFVHYSGRLRFAFQNPPEKLLELLPAISYIGKRGGFIQFVKTSEMDDLCSQFTRPLIPLDLYTIVNMTRVHLATLDDFGPQVTFARLNSFSSESIRRGKDRQFVQTVVPLGLVRTGPGFSEYEAASEQNSFTNG